MRNLLLIAFICLLSLGACIEVGNRTIDRNNSMGLENPVWKTFKHYAGSLQEVIPKSRSGDLWQHAYLDEKLPDYFLFKELAFVPITILYDKYEMLHPPDSKNNSTSIISNRNLSNNLSNLRNYPYLSTNPYQFTLRGSPRVTGSLNRKIQCDSDIFHPKILPKYTDKNYLFYSDKLGEFSLEYNTNSG